MALTAYVTPSVSAILASSAAVGALLGAWALRFPKLAVGFLAASLVAGQLLRFPLPGQGGGLLLSDIATVLVLLSAVLQKASDQRLRNQKIENRNQIYFPISSFYFLFILWSAFTLIIHIPNLGLNNSLIASLYWLRLVATLALLPALFILFRNTKLRNIAHRLLLGAVGLLVILGFFQLVFLPNLQGPVLRSLGGGGWDPHQGRLFSTWLDPNLFGGFLIITIPWLVTAVNRNWKLGNRSNFYFLFSIFLLFGALVALLLTQSRSSFIALSLAALLLSPICIWQLRRLPERVRVGVAASGLLGAIGLVALIITFAPHRLLGLLTFDDTAALRATSLTSAWHLSEQHPWLGVGYNAYQFAAASRGLISDFTVHSRAGADSSLLTLAVTVGLPGITTFVLPWIAVVTVLLHRAVRGDALALGAAGSTIALAMHSQFVNSFLYSHLLITLIIIVALCLSTKQVSSSSPRSSPLT